MSLFKKLSLLFLASFFVLLFNIFPVNNKANAASFDVTLRVLEDNGNNDWNKPGVDKCYLGDVEVQVRDANSTRTVKYTSGPDSCGKEIGKAIKVFNSPEAGEPTAYTVKLITPNRSLSYIDVYYLTPNSPHSTFKGSAISTNAVSPKYEKTEVTFGLKEKNNGTNTCADPKLTPAGKEGNTFTVKIKNPCNSEHDYKLKANPPGGANSGWKAKISGNKVNDNDVITVGKNDTAQFKVKIDPPDNPSEGTHTTVVLATQKDGNSNNKDTIKLKTVIDRQQSCSRKDPVLSSSDKEKNGKKGETITYNVELKNNNSECKDPADFDISVDKPNGWSVKILKGNGDKFDGMVDNLPSGNSRLFKVKISSPNNAQNGTSKTITIKAVQKGHNNLKDSIALKYTVGQNDNACTGSNIKPHFECQSNACVVVQSCGTNSGGCTSAGGSCGGNSCEGSDVKPHFECENNACVKKASCGQNTEGCTQGGQSCGGGGDPTKLSFVIGLDSIGTTGTNTVALSNNSNKNPKHPQRAISVEVLDNTNQKVEEVEGDINYVSDKSAQNYGKFIGKVTLGDDFSTGNYIVKVKVDGRLKKQISGIQRLEAGKINSMDPVNLIAGDIDNDNKIGILDYGILISCSIFAKTEQAKALCSENKNFKLLSDLNDDGENANTPRVDQLDYGYFIQEYSVQAGD